MVALGCTITSGRFCGFVFSDDPRGDIPIPIVSNLVGGVDEMNANSIGTLILITHNLPAIYARQKEECNRVIIQIFPIHQFNFHQIPKIETTPEGHLHLILDPDFDLTSPNPYL